MNAHENIPSRFRSAVKHGRMACAFVSFSLAVSVPLTAHGAELIYTLQSPLVGGHNAALQAAENARYNAIKQAYDRKIADEQRRIREAAQAAESTPEARFVSSLQQQIYFAISQKIATSITSLSNGAAGSFQTGDNIVSYIRSGNELTVTITTPLGTSIMKLPTGNL